VRLASDNASDSRGLSIIWVIPFRGTLDHAVTVVVRYPRTTYTCVCVCVCVSRHLGCQVDDDEPNRKSRGYACVRAEARVVAIVSQSPPRELSPVES